MKSEYTCQAFDEFTHHFPDSATIINAALVAKVSVTVIEA